MFRSFIALGYRISTSVTLVILTFLQFMIDGDTVIEYKTITLPLRLFWRDIF